jgi:hypothetical protein
MELLTLDLTDSNVGRTRIPEREWKVMLYSGNQIRNNDS